MRARDRDETAEQFWMYLAETDAYPIGVRRAESNPRGNVRVRSLSECVASHTRG